MAVGPNTPSSTSTPTVRTAPTVTSQVKPAESAPTPTSANPVQKLTQVAADFSSEQALGLSPLPNAGQQQPGELYEDQSRKKEQAAQLDDQLRRAYAGELPEQVKRNKDNAVRTEQRADARFSEKEKISAQTSREREAAERECKAALLRSFATEHQILDSAQKNFNQSASDTKKFLNAETQRELEAHLQFREEAGNVGKPGGLTAEEFKTKVETEQKSLMDKLARKDGYSMTTDGQNQLKRLLKDHDQLQKAKNFPHTPALLQAWKADQLAKRNRALAAAGDKSRGNEIGHAGDLNRIQSDAAAANAAGDKKITDKLQAASDEAHTVTRWDLNDSIQSAEAFPGETARGRDTADGVEFRSPDGKQVLATVKEGADKRVTVSADRPDRSSESVLTPAGNGRYTESSTTTNYQTSGQPGAPTRGEVKNETILRKDADGKEIYRRLETPGKDGSSVVNTTTDEGGVQNTLRETRVGDQTVASYNTRNEKIDGQQVETTDHHYENKTHYHSVEKTRADKTKTQTETWTKPESTSERTKVTDTRVDGSYTYRDTRKPKDPNDPSTSTETMELSKDGKNGTGTRVTTEAGYRSEIKIAVRDGKKTEVDVTTYDNNTVSTTVSLDGKIQNQRSVQQIKADPDVPGLGWIGSQNAQDLVQMLGDEDKLKAERIIESAPGPDGEMVSRESTKLIGNGGNSELSQTKGANGGNMWTLRKKNDDGTWNSQTFFQGSEDTITNTTRKEGDFQIQEEKSSTPKLAKDSMTVIPSSGRTRVHTSESASGASVNKMLEGHQMEAVRKSDSYQEFLRQNGTGQLKVLAQDGVSSTEGQGDKLSGSLVLESPNGRRLTAVYDPIRGSYLVQNETMDGKEPSRQSVLKGDERLEIDSRGNAREIKKVSNRATEETQDQVVWTRPARELDEAVGTVKRATETVMEGSEGAKSVAQMMGASDSNRLVRYADALGDSKWSGLIGRGVNSGAAALSGLSLAADIANKDWKRVADKGAALGCDVADLVQSFEAQAAKSARAAGGTAAEVARASRFGLVSAGARVLGVAGVLTGSYMTGQDLVEGKYTRAGLGLASAGFGAYALFGAASFAGPLGWGVAGAAGLATMAWDYNDGTKIADLAI